jgi:hypothetical protein
MNNADASVATMTLTLQDGPQWTDVMTALATLATSVAAVVGIFFAWSQLRQARNAAKEATASAIYRSFLERALEYPDFVAPVPSYVDTEKETFKFDRGEFRRYEQFVDLMLTTFEEMIKVPRKKRGEEFALVDNYINGWLFDHRQYLQSRYYERRFRKMVSDELWKRIQTAADPSSAAKLATTGSDR